MKINFYPRTETSIIYLWVSMFNKQKALYNTEIKINKSDWDKKKQKIKTSVKGAESVNNRLAAMEKKIRDEYDRLIGIGIKPTFEGLRKLFEIKEAEPEPERLTFLKFMEERIDYEFDEGFISKSRKNHERVSLAHLTRFAKENKFDFDSINEEFYKKFVAFMAKDEMLNNSIGTIISHLKKHCTIAVKNKLLNTLDYQDFKVLKESKIKKPKYGEEDILKLYGMSYYDPRIKKAVDLNVFRYYTGGMRHGDSQLVIGRSNIVSVQLADGTKAHAINISQEKTDAPNVILLNTICIDILEKYNYKLPRFASSSACNKFMKQAFKIAGYNKMVLVIRHSGKKRIEKEVPEWELFGKSHSARYSAARMIATKSKGNLLLAKEMLGQADIRTTQSYVDSDEQYKHEEYYKIIK
jgi:site-specific recombinase XerD